LANPNKIRGYFYAKQTKFLDNFNDFVDSSSNWWFLDGPHAAPESRVAHHCSRKKYDSNYMCRMNAIL
jgi:hypothetical protein